MNTRRLPLAALAALCLLTACGGGGSDPRPLTSNTAARDIVDPDAPQLVATHVQLEGCVLDDHDQPRATRVHAFGPDGRLVATAASSADGRFVLTVPSRQHLSVGLDAPGHESLSLLSGDGNFSVSACLRDRSAA